MKPAKKEAPGELPIHRMRYENKELSEKSIFIIAQYAEDCKRGGTQYGRAS